MTKEEMFTLLAENGVESVVIEYSGSGDEGGIDLVSINPEQSTSLESQLEEFAYEQLDALPYDWINNDGGSGVMEINVAAKTITVEHEQNYSSSEHSTHNL